MSPPFKGTEARDFWSRFFSRIYSIWAQDFEAKRIFFSLLFSRSYSNISMNRGGEVAQMRRRGSSN
jgi:hypothetical protein